MSNEAQEALDHAYEDCPNLATCGPHGARWVLTFHDDEPQRLGGVS